jgi:hypothetical protein
VVKLNTARPPNTEKQPAGPHETAISGKKMTYKKEMEQQKKHISGRTNKRRKRRLMPNQDIPKMLVKPR